MKTLINIDVPDIAEAVTFYSKALGLNLAKIIDDDVAELSGGSSVIYLLQKDSGTAFSNLDSGSRQYARHWTPVHLDFVVDDFQVARQRALDAGAVCESECVEWRGSKCVTFSDPFGHGFCLIEFLGDAYV